MLLSKKNKYIKAIGFKHDQQGIVRRYMRERNHWDTHLNNCKRFIIKAASQKQKQNVMVLGSGWLLDVPVNQLVNQFNKVYLVDIIHPPQIKHKIKNFANVQLIEADITGGAVNNLYNFVKKHRKHKTQNASPIKPDNIVPQINLQNLCFAGLPEYEMDFVVSLNLLNQLDILLVDYIKKYNCFSQSDIIQLKKQIQQQHLAGLPENKTCLITDYEELNYSVSDKLLQKKTLVHVALPKAKQKEQWQWHFDSKQYYHHNAKTVFNVIAIDF